MRMSELNVFIQRLFYDIEMCRVFKRVVNEMKSGELEKVLRFEEISSFFFEWEKSADSLLVLAFHGIIFTQWSYYFIAFLMKFQFPFSRFRKKILLPCINLSQQSKKLLNKIFRKIFKNSVACSNRLLCNDQSTHFIHIE